MGPEQRLCEWARFCSGHKRQPYMLRWEGEQAQARTHGPQSQNQGSKHVPGMKSVPGRAGFCKQRECQGDPEKAAEVMRAGEGQDVGRWEPWALSPCVNVVSLMLQRLRDRPSLTDKHGTDLV